MSTNISEETHAALSRIEKREPYVSALARPTADRALATAKALDALAGAPAGASLFGRSYVAKDLIDTALIPTEAGSRVLAGRVPARNATVIDRLDRAGAVLLGKAHTHEFAYGVTTPATNNPHDLLRTAGGSSGGSAAAVAAGYCDLALGTDTMGSVRIPAALCGVVGLRPTTGRVPTDGVVALSWTLDAVGPITSTVKDAAELLHAIAGPSERDPNSCLLPPYHPQLDLDGGVAGLTIGVPNNYFFDNVMPEVEDAVRSALGLLQKAGAVLKGVTLPMAELALPTGFALSLPESSEAHRQWFSPDAPYGDDVRPYLELGLVRPGIEYVRAMQLRTALIREWRRATAGLDAVVGPMLPCTAPLKAQDEVELPHGNEGVVAALLRLTAPASVLGLPSLSVPCQPAGSHLPIGLQIIGRPLDEATVLRIGAAVESVVQPPRVPLDERIPQ